METLDPRSIPRPTQVASDWAKRRTYTAAEIPPVELLLAHKRAEGLRLTVGIPAANHATSIGPTCRQIRRDLMLKVPLVDELLVFDVESRDETVLQARAAGAGVVHVRELIREVASREGRGDVLWRSLAAMAGDIIVWLDPSIGSVQRGAVERLVAPFLLDPTVAFVKGYHDRPVELDVEIGDVVYFASNGRTAELLVRPLLSIFFPELGGFLDPLAGAFAGRREYLRQIPIFSGCSCDVGALIDFLDVVGLDGMAQAEIGGRRNDDQRLDVLASRGHAITRTILKRAEERNRIKLPSAAAIHPMLVPGLGGLSPIRIDEIERPPIEVLPPYLAVLAADKRLLATEGARSDSVGV